MSRTKSFGVTLVVYRWRESAPGTLSWVFPSVRAAMRAARAFRNALAWFVVEGPRTLDADVDVDKLRRSAWVLAECAA